MSFAFCSALRRNPAPPVTMLRLTAVPTRKWSLKRVLQRDGLVGGFGSRADGEQRDRQEDDVFNGFHSDSYWGTSLKTLPRVWALS